MSVTGRTWQEELRMRGIILATTLIAASSIAMAQNSGNMGGRAATGSQGTTSSSGQMASQGSGENCGTPDEPKACPPLPKRPLKYYPANKQ
jgi:hypothetical protein